MGIFSRMFGGSGKPSEPPRDVEALAAHLVQPAVHALAAPFPHRGHSTVPIRSWFCGDPCLSSGVNWPELAGRRLDFLACVDLAELAAVTRIDWLPSTGNLSFFYDLDKQPWGFDPKDRGSWAVVYQPESATPPSLQSHAMKLHALLSYPPSERMAVQALKLSEEEMELYVDLEVKQIGIEFFHQLGGYPKPIQGDELELGSQLASNGVYCGDGKGYESERGRALSPGAADWRLLFQVATDEKLGFHWGDGGNLYFMIREQDARAKRFENAWLVTQCF